jgi:hypothetical protein
MTEKKGKTPEGIEYSYYSCNACGEEIVDLKQLHEVAQKYRELKQYSATVSKWGESLAIRIPKQLAKEYKLKENKQVSLIPEEKAIKIVA